MFYPPYLGYKLSKEKDRDLVKKKIKYGKLISISQTLTEHYVPGTELGTQQGFNSFATVSFLDRAQHSHCKIRSFSYVSSQGQHGLGMNFNILFQLLYA